MFGNARLRRTVARRSARSVGVNRQQPTVRTETHDIVRRDIPTTFGHPTAWNRVRPIGTSVTFDDQPIAAFRDAWTVGSRNDRSANVRGDDTATDEADFFALPVTRDERTRSHGQQVDNDSWRVLARGRACVCSLIGKDASRLKTISRL